MVLREVGEPRRLQVQTVDPPLIKAVGRGLEGKVGHAPTDQIRRHAGHGFGVRGGEARTGQRFAFQLKSKRAETGRAAPQAAEDLAAEGGDRGLAVSAGDRHDDFGLRAPEATGGEGVGSADIHGADQRRAHEHPRLSAVVIGQHRAGALFQRHGDEAASIRGGSRQRRKQIARPNLAAVGGHARNQRVDLDGPPDQFRQSADRLNTH